MHNNKIREVVELNNLKNVHLHQKAISLKNEIVYLSRSDADFLGVSANSYLDTQTAQGFHNWEYLRTYKTVYQTSPPTPYLATLSGFLF